MPDRTAEVAQFIQDSYPAFELVLVRLSNAFDKRWWKTVRGGPLTKSDFAVQLDDPGALGRPIPIHIIPVLITPSRRSRVQTLS